MSSASTAHIICGPIAAGKSTYAAKLATDTNAVSFSIDNWMQKLYGPDQPEKLDMAWVMERVERCRTVIWSVCVQILASGRDAVLDIGLMREADRRTMIAAIEQAGHTCRLHFLDAPRNVRFKRLAKRNLDRGATYSFEVTPSMFDAIDPHFEPPSETECAYTTITTTADGCHA